MADLYLLEAGVDHYLLEDGSGSYQLEQDVSADVFFRNKQGIEFGMVAATAAELGGVLIE